MSVALVIQKCVYPSVETWWCSDSLQRSKKITNPASKLVCSALLYCNTTEKTQRKIQIIFLYVLGLAYFGFF